MAVPVPPTVDIRPPRGKFDATKVSPSRLNSYVSCGVAFQKDYIHGERPQRGGSAALYGNVIHKALEQWGLNRSADLVNLVGHAWMDLTAGTPVADFIQAYRNINIEVMRAEKVARDAFEKRNPDKESKAPRMTKEFKESDACRKLNRLLGEWIPKLNEGSYWLFTERDPLPSLYDESLVSAKKYQAKWRHLPTALYTEFEFSVEWWNGFTLNGHVDSIESVMTEDGELVGYLILDYKTYRKEPSPLKDWRQLCMYDVVIRQMIQTGQLALDSHLPLYVACDYFRLGERKDWVIGPADHEKLMEELLMYRRGVEA
ncbi:MAG: PD-(D/E)XK nuclease family protein, partial [Actinobacteria bacterium]|nr:PD-(D/E)XK nuclease family protein [Actinomycetota bacterium]